MKPNDLEKLLIKNGWVEVRSCGSHKTYKKVGEQKIITIPFHNKDLKIGTLNQTLKKCSVEIVPTTPQGVIKRRIYYV